MRKLRPIKKMSDKEEVKSTETTETSSEATPPSSEKQEKVENDTKEVSFTKKTGEKVQFKRKVKEETDGRKKPRTPAQSANAILQGQRYREKVAEREKQRADAFAKYVDEKTELMHQKIMNELKKPVQTWFDSLADSDEDAPPAPSKEKTSAPVQTVPTTPASVPAHVSRPWDTFGRAAQRRTTIGDAGGGFNRSFRRRF
jgi:hypothetical protein